MSRSFRYGILGLLFVVVVWAFPQMAQQGTKGGEWHAYGGETGSTHYSPLDVINRDNFKNLQIAWSWKFDNFGGGTSETTPIMVNGVLYFTVGQRRNVVAVNP